MVENFSPLRTQAGAFCVFLLRILLISIKIFNQGVCPQPHLASMAAVQKQVSISRRLRGQMWLGIWSLDSYLCKPMTP